MRKTFTLLAVLLALFLILPLAATVSAAEEDETDPPLTPDSPVYGLQRAMEQVQLRLTHCPSERASLVASQMHRRTEELGQSMQKGRSEHAPGLIRAAERLAEKLDFECEELDLENTDLTEVADIIEGSTSRALERLDELKEQLPDEADDGLRNAIDRIEENRQFAWSVLEGIVEGEFPGDADRAEQLLQRARQRGGNGPEQLPGPPWLSDEEEEPEGNGGD